MTTDRTSRFVRLRVDVLLEVNDHERLAGEAVRRVESDTLLPEEERRQAVATVRADASEAVAHLVDPVELVRALPGTELAQASWSCEETETVDVADALEWELDEDLLDDGPDGGGPDRHRP